MIIETFEAATQCKKNTAQDEGIFHPCNFHTADYIFCGENKVIFSANVTIAFSSSLIIQIRKWSALKQTKFKCVLSTLASEKCCLKRWDVNFSHQTDRALLLRQPSPLRTDVYFVYNNILINYTQTDHISWHWSVSLVYSFVTPGFACLTTSPSRAIN